MGISTIKLNLAKKIIDTDDKDIINHIKAVFDTHSKTNWFEELPDDVRKSVEKGLKEADKGQGTPHKVVMERVRKWLKK